MNQQDLISIYKAIYPTTAEYILFSCIHGTYTKINITLGHNTKLNKFKELK